MLVLTLQDTTKKYHFYHKPFSKQDETLQRLWKHTILIFRKIFVCHQELFLPESLCCITKSVHGYLTDRAHCTVSVCFFLPPTITWISIQAFSAEDIYATSVQANFKRTLRALILYFLPNRFLPHTNMSVINTVLFLPFTFWSSETLVKDRFPSQWVLNNSLENHQFLPFS